MASGAVSAVLLADPLNLKERFPVIASLPAWLADALVIGPYVVFAGLLGYNILAAPYLIYRDKPARASKAKAEELVRLWREGQVLYEQRVEDGPGHVLWRHAVDQWASTVILRLREIEPREAFAFESIGAEHSLQGIQDDNKRHYVMRIQLSARLSKLRLRAVDYLGR